MNKIIQCMPFPLLVGTSLLFTTNAIHAYYTQHEIYHHLWVLLTASSILYHSIIDPVCKQKWRKIDMTIVGCIVLHGVYLIPLCSVACFFFSITTCSMCVFLYTHKQYLELQDETNHAIIHIIGSLGHHGIMYSLTQI